MATVIETRGSPHPSQCVKAQRIVFLNAGSSPAWPILQTDDRKWEAGWDEREDRWMLTAGNSTVVDLIKDCGFSARDRVIVKVRFEEGSEQEVEADTYAEVEHGGVVANFNAVAVGADQMLHHIG